MSDAIKVTVDGEPVTREVTLEQVRAYLRAKGWEKRDEHAWEDGRWEMWTPPGKPRQRLYLWDCPNDLSDALSTIARHEQRHPAAVLREIAGDVAAPAEARADEIEAEIARHGCARSFEDAIRFAREAREDAQWPVDEAQQAQRRLDAAAWLVVAGRTLAREAGR